MGSGGFFGGGFGGFGGFWGLRGHKKGVGLIVIVMFGDDPCVTVCFVVLIFL